MTFAVLALAVAYFGLNFNPAETNTPTDSRIYPIGPAAFRMIQPDGQSRLFRVSDPKTGMLTGPRPWLGVLKGNRVDIWADPEITGGRLRTAFTFVDGRLRLLVLDGENYTFPSAKAGRSDLQRLFPPRKVRSYEKNSAADIWQSGGNRVRLWFANPNSAGAMTVEISLLLLWFMIRRRRWGRVVAGVFLAVSLYILFATGSRGALVGLLAGVLAIGAEHVRCVFTRKGLAVIVLGLLVLIGGLAVSGNLGRGLGTFRSIDQGNMTRLKIGKAAVEMFADAPLGWHGGEVPGRNACLNWYVHDELRSLRTHLMSLAECGWFLGFLYLAFWAWMLAVGFVAAKRGEPLIAAMWIGFGAAGCFNPVYTDWETWVLPLISLGLLVMRSRRLSPREWRTVAIAALSIAAAVVVILVTIGKLTDRPVKTMVSSNGAATFINGDDPNIWIVGDPLVMAGGGFPGREILPYYDANPKLESVAYVYSVNDLPTSAELVVVAGRNVPDYLSAFNEGRACKAVRLLMLSPSVGPSAVPPQLLESSELIWLAGSLLAEREPSYGECRPWIKIVPGCERYIPNWLGISAAIRRK